MLRLSAIKQVMRNNKAVVLRQICTTDQSLRNPAENSQKLLAENPKIEKVNSNIFEKMEEKPLPLFLRKLKLKKQPSLLTKSNMKHELFLKPKGKQIYPKSTLLTIVVMIPAVAIKALTDFMSMLDKVDWVVVSNFFITEQIAIISLSIPFALNMMVVGTVLVKGRKHLSGDYRPLLKHAQEKSGELLVAADESQYFQAIAIDSLSGLHEFAGLFKYPLHFFNWLRSNRKEKVKKQEEVDKAAYKTVVFSQARTDSDTVGTLKLEPKHEGKKLKVLLIGEYVMIQDEEGKTLNSSAQVPTAYFNGCQVNAYQGFHEILIFFPITQHMSKHDSRVTIEVPVRCDQVIN